MKAVKKPLISSLNFALGLVVMLLTLTTGCSRKFSNLDSILVIAFDGLGYSDINCLDSNEPNKSGFSILCHEGIRFSHAYTTSPLTIPAATSLLTGLYPAEHGLRHNGAQSLSPNAMPIAKLAAQNGYRTALFSGGPPFLRRSGLQIGFEVFNDSMFVSYNSFYRPIQSSIRLIKNWYDEIGSDPFFSFFYSSDLNHPEIPTITDNGENRILSVESQLQEIDESLFDLFSDLKKRNRWDNTLIIVTGLSGRSLNTRLKEFSATNLHSETTQVALFIKPAKKKSDDSMSWKVDRNVSIADVGATLYEIVGQKPLVPVLTDLPRASLKAVLNRGEPNWPDDRLILTESAWDQWKNKKEIRYSLRADQYLFIWDQAPKLFNTLIDRLENSETPLEPGSGKDKSLFFTFFKEHNWPRYTPPSVNEIRKLQLQFPNDQSSPKLWNDFGLSLNTLAIGLPHDEQISNYQAYYYFWTQDWQALRKLGQQWKRSEWTFIAEKNLRLASDIEPPSCFSYFVKSPNKNEARKCLDTSVVDLHEWTQNEIGRKKFLQSYSSQKLRLNFATQNFNLGQPLDMATTRDISPLTVDLILTLPELQKYRNSTTKAHQDQEQQFDEL